MIEANASLADRFAILTSIPGVSNITAFALLIAMPELGALGPPEQIQAIVDALDAAAKTIEQI